MTTPTFPYAGEQPLLMKKEPLDCPRNNPLNNRFARLPIVLSWIINAKGRKIRAMPVPIDVLWRFASPPRVLTDGWVQNKYADAGIVQIPAIEVPARNVDDTYAIDLANRSKRPLPHAEPLGMRNQLELRAFSPQQSVLLKNRKRTHSNQSPHGLLLGVARAADGIAVDPRAGMLPSRRMWKPRPVSLSLTC